MDNSRWVLIDTETTGLATPIYVVEIAAQLMQGWAPLGPSFRRLINQNAVIPPEASRVHGYTKEILERDGEPPNLVYKQFSEYAQGLPVVAFNLDYDWDQVLVPEWSRLGLTSTSSRGFCALRLAQRLLDPVPAGNCKLQTLRQFYRLPERGAHTALGDVETVVDLLSTVLSPLANTQGLDTWRKVVDYTNEPWFPSRIAFGKYKGRLYKEALHDIEIRNWLEWLSCSTNERSSLMGRWYLSRLNQSADRDSSLILHAVDDEISIVHGNTHVVIYSNPKVVELKSLVESARSRLVELEAQYTVEKHAVDVTQSILFGLLKGHYQKRDRLKLVLEYRRKYLDFLIRHGEEEAEQVAQAYKEAKQHSDNDYEEAEAVAQGRKELSKEDSAELRSIWKKLVKTYHPDRFANEPEKHASFTKLTSEINLARDKGDIETLREIANDPKGFMLRHGFSDLNFDDVSELAALQKLLDTLQIKILETLEAIALLKEDPRYELHILSCQNPGYLAEIAKTHVNAIDQEMVQLKSQADELQAEINDLVDDLNVIE